MDSGADRCAGGDDDALDDDNDNGGEESPGETKRVRPGEGFYYQSDVDDALLDDIFDEGYQDKHFSSIPNKPHYERSRNRILGGPQLNPNAMSNKKRRYLAEQKQFTDKTRCQLYKQMNATDAPMSPLVKGHDEMHTGDKSKKIRLMAIVKSSPLEVGHSFKNKPELMLRIVEEADLRNI